MSSVSDLRKYIDDKSLELYSDWQSPLRASAYIGTTHFPKCDILQFAGDKYKKDIPTKVSFCPKTFPIHDGFKGVGFKNLYKVLLQTSLNQGFKLVMNGNFQITTSFAYEKKSPSQKIFMFPLFSLSWKYHQ